MGDGGYAQHEALDQAAQQQVTLYAPVPKPRKGDTRDPHAPREDDSEVVAAWRQRMGTEEARAIYTQRAATAETVNADAKEHRGLDSVPGRGLDKALGAASLFALTYNILRLITLGGCRVRRRRAVRRQADDSTSAISTNRAVSRRPARPASRWTHGVASLSVCYSCRPITAAADCCWHSHSPSSRWLCRWASGP